MKDATFKIAHVLKNKQKIFSRDEIRLVMECQMKSNCEKANCQDNCQMILPENICMCMTKRTVFDN